MTQDPRITTSFSHESPSPAPGATLRRARLEQQVTRDWAREQLGLTGTLFDALEDDDYERLPAPVFVKGYLRRYAAILGLRPTPVLAAYERELDRRQPAEEPETAPAPSATPDRPLMAMVISALSLLLATSLVFGAMLSDGDAAATDAGEAVETAPSARETAADSPVAARQTVPADNRLALEFVKDSWVEVVDARDHILAVSLQRAGSRLDLEGQPPFEVRLGYAPGVRITYRGEAVELEPDNSDDTAVETVIGS